MTADNEQSQSEEVVEDVLEQTFDQNNREYLAEDVLKHAREAFAETVSLKVQQLYRYVPKGSNSALTGHFVEEVVKGFVQSWLGERRLVSGTFCSNESVSLNIKPMQIDGIVYDPRKGPLVLDEGGFAVVHPAFCTSAFEFKTSIRTVSEFQDRLRSIYTNYMHHGTTCQVMGIVISDKDAVGKSVVSRPSGDIPAYHHFNAGWCPIFILFTEKDGEYEPHFDAIDAMIRSVYRNQYSGVNYIS